MKHRIVRRDKFYKGRAFELEQVLMRLPDGRDGCYDLIVHKGSVTIVPIDDECRLYFVSQFRLGALKELLELPAGTLDEGEAPLRCAKRELSEEIGFSARHWKKLGEIYLAPGYSSEYMTIFLAAGLYPDRLPGDRDEFLTVKTIPLDEVNTMIQSDQINDGKTLAALLLAMPILDKKCLNKD